MSQTTPMTPLRRRPMPGMPAAPPAPPARPDTPPGHELDPVENSSGAPTSSPASRRRTRPSKAPSDRPRETGPRRHPVEDYSSTHLTNFRVPIDLHARYGRLLAEAQDQHPRLRKMSLTEVIVALLAEGPQTPYEVAELVRRKRADEHAEETQR
jgi:hypothetical protein